MFIQLVDILDIKTVLNIKNLTISIIILYLYLQNVYPSEQVKHWYSSIQIVLSRDEY